MERSEALARILKLGNLTVSLTDSEVPTAEMSKKNIKKKKKANFRELPESIAMLAYM